MKKLIAAAVLTLIVIPVFSIQAYACGLDGKNKPVSDDETEVVAEAI